MLDVCIKSRALYLKIYNVDVEQINIFKNLSDQIIVHFLLKWIALTSFVFLLLAHFATSIISMHKSEGLIMTLSQKHTSEYAIYTMDLN